MDIVDPSDTDDSTDDEYQGSVSAMAEEMDVMAVHEVERSVTQRGVEIRARAYLENDEEESVLWRVGSSVGDRGLVDARRAELILPQGRKVSFDGEVTNRIPIPPYFLDALIEDFEELHEDVDGDSD